MRGQLRSLVKRGLRKVGLLREPPDVRPIDPSYFPLARPDGESVSSVVPVSTVAPFHNSIGDLSTAQITQEFLARSGVPSYLTSFWDHDHEHLVIGGGEIAGAPLRGAWRYVKPLFLPEGRHVLNAVGVQENIRNRDLGVLQDYLYVSVRDHEGAEMLRASGKVEAAVVPCPATLQHGIPLELLPSLPRFERLSDLEVGNYVVVHKHPTLRSVAQQIARSGHQVVVVDMQAHALHAWGRTGLVVPSTHSPPVIMGLVRSSMAVITSSLHLAIFALGASIPFVAIDTDDDQSTKVRRYLSRAGASDCFSKQPSLELALSRQALVEEVGAKERERARDHLRKVVASLVAEG